MSRDDGAGAGSVLLAFLLGAVSGAAVALLYAPATGRETREYLGERAREGRERASEAAQKGREAIDRGREAISQGRETLSTAIDRGREAYQQTRGREKA
jgi:gas vesicle protein